MKRSLLALAFLLIAQSTHATCDGTTTTNLGICKPNHGSYTDNWETVLNPNYDLLDFSFVSPLLRSGTAVSLGTVPMSKGGTGTTTTTKGDILVGSGTAWAKEAACPNGQVKIYDSTQTNGVKCGTVAGSGGPPFTDSTSISKGSVDATKKLRFEVDGLSTGVTRVVDAPEADAQMAVKSGSFTDGHGVKYDSASKTFKDSGSAAGGGAAKQIFASNTGAGTIADSGLAWYMPISGEGVSQQENDHVMLVPVAGTAKTFCCREIDGSGGAGVGYTYTLRDSCTGDTPITCDAFNSDGCCATGLTVDVGDLCSEETMTIKAVSTSGATTTRTHCSFVLEFR